MSLCVVNYRVAELQHHLDMALKEIEVMKENRQRQAEMVRPSHNDLRIVVCF